MKHQGSHQSRI